MTKITEETRIKDLIPENRRFEAVAVESNNEYINLNVYLKSKYKTFWDYRDEYEDEVYQGALDVCPRNWHRAEKLDLLWHMIKDYGGDIGDLGNIMQVIHKPQIRYYGACERVRQLLPQQFIDSFKEEIDKVIL